ncbi:MAG: addiction module protein [Propionibacteriaceae bacterium]|jgi:hypothetical protein|nr:addiction module protein [Propionibacteriaceae bacterium]
MVTPSLLEQIQALSTEEKISLIDSLWQSVGDTVTDDEAALAREGLHFYRENPTATRPSEDVIADLRTRYL